MNINYYLLFLAETFCIIIIFTVNYENHIKSNYKIRAYSIGEIFLYLFERKLKIRLPISNKLRWNINTKSEIRFWDKCIRTNGMIWPEEYQQRFDKNLLLQEEIVKLLPDYIKISILDVGAGPFTYIGKVYNNFNINITAVDPLSDEYDKLLKKYSISPIVRTQKLEAEKLTTRFKENTFDLVFARNSIDHSYFPEISVLEMIKVVKRNCYVLLLHRPNEAKQENWQGLHQWNFSNENDDFIISSKKYRINFSKKYSDICRIKCRLNESENMLYTEILKI